MISLGIDPSLTGLGWCVINTGVTGSARVLGRGVFSTRSDQLFVWRNIYLRESVSRVLDLYPEIQTVGVESPVYGEQFSEGAYGLYVYVNEAVYRHRKDVVYFDPLSIKMLAKMDPSIRRGYMDKGDIIDAVRAETFIRKWDNNEADAYIVARSAASFWELHGGILTPEDLVPAEYNAYTRVMQIKRRGKLVEVRSGALFKEGSRYFRFSQIPVDSPMEITLQRS